jgi:hypothetical protein
VIRRDYASGKRPGPVARPAPEPRQQPWRRLARGLVPGLAIGALAAWLLLRHHAPAPVAASAVATAPAVAAPAAPVKVALPPRQPSTYTFYHELTRDKASQQADSPKQP